MAQPRMRTAKTPMTRQNATHRLNANQLSTVKMAEILEAYPPPEWMGDKAQRLWANAIASYHPGQFKRYNLPMLEQYVLITMNINKLTRRIGYTTGLVKPTMILEDDGSTAKMETSASSEYKLYRSLILLLSRVCADLHMPPRPYVMMSSSESETLDETIRQEEDEDEEVGDNGRPVYRQGNRIKLLGGRQAVN